MTKSRLFWVRVRVRVRLRLRLRVKQIRVSIRLHGVYPPPTYHPIAQIRVSVKLELELGVRRPIGHAWEGCMHNWHMG